MGNPSSYTRPTISALKPTWSKHSIMTTTLGTLLYKDSMKKDDRLIFPFRKPSRLASKLSIRIRRDSDWLTLSSILMSDTTQTRHRAAVSSIMERLLAHWHIISKQSHSGINLVEFLAEDDNGPVLSFDNILAAPADLEDTRP